MKRFFTLLWVLCILASSLCAVAEELPEAGLPAVQEQPAEELSDFEVEDGVLSVYSGSGEEALVPAEVTAIGENAFSGAASLKRIVVPAGVTSIGGNAFAAEQTVITPAGSFAADYCRANGIPLSELDPNIGIYSQPKDTTIKKDKSVKFSVSALGEGLTYQWQYRKNASESWKKSGASTADQPTVKVKATQKKDGYQYRCLIADRNGNTAETEPATLKIAPAVKIKSQPKDASASEGDEVTFSVEASGLDLIYQWQYRETSSSPWVNSEAKAASLPEFSTKGTYNKNGYQYRCIVSDPYGSKKKSSVATLTVASSLAITAQPRNSTLSKEGTVTFSVTATGKKIKYQWQYRKKPSKDWKDSSAETADQATIRIKGTESKNGYQYRCVVTDQYECQVFSDPVTLTVKTAPLAVTVQPVDLTVKEGSSVTFSVKSSGEGLTYQWQYRENASESWKKSGASTARQSAITVNGTMKKNGYQYRCVVTDAEGNKVKSSPATMTVQSLLKIKSQPEDVTAVEGESVKLTVKASGDGLTYQWQYRKTPSGDWKESGASSAAKPTLKVKGTAGKNGYQYRCVVTDAYGETVVTDPVTITVNQK